MGFKKIFAIILVAAITFITLSVTAFASESKAVHVFDKRDYYKTDFVMEEDREYEVPHKGILRIEKGATLWVEGELKVFGIIKNYGTIIIRQREPNIHRQEEKVESGYGHISVSGELRNYGTIKVENGSLHNLKSGKITNSGSIILDSVNSEVVALRNIGSGTGTAAQGGEIINDKTGVISVLNKEGIGFISQKGATFQNSGTINMKRATSAKGKISGNAVNWID